MSAAASGLLRALIARAGLTVNRILLTDIRSTDWQSLTFVGERHQLELRITGPDAMAAARRLGDGLEEAEFQIPRQIVADIAVIGELRSSQDGSVTVKIEALTVEE